MVVLEIIKIYNIIWNIFLSVSYLIKYSKEYEHFITSQEKSEILRDSSLGPFKGKCLVPDIYFIIYS